MITLLRKGGSINMRVYLDNAATTAVKKEVVEAMLPYLTEHFGNPSSLHGFAREAHQGLDKARKQIANVLGAKEEEIVFTGGGSESDNTVLRGVVQQYKKKGKHIITTVVEHHAILHTKCSWLVLTLRWIFFKKDKHSAFPLTFWLHLDQ